MAFFRDPGEMFLGCLGTVEQRYLVNLIKNAAKNGYTRFVEPCAGTFAMSNLAIQNGYKPEQIETSDVSMMSSVMGYAITGKPLDELEIHAQGFSDEELLDPAVALYAQMYLRTSKTAGNEYFFNLLKDLRDRREEHIEHIRQSLENIKKEMYGMTYRPLDMWDHLDEVLDDPHTLVIANPPTYFSGYEKFYDTQGKMTWKEPEYKLFDPETGHVELFDRCMNANDCLLINGPDTGYKDKIVIFAGGAASDSYKKIRGNSYGMWIATEINLHHDNTIKEAFNRQLAAKNRKIFWDLNPDHPKAAIYVDYIDKYAEKAAKGELLGGYNYEHFNIFENINIPKQRIAEIVSQYDKDSIWYIRDIEGKRSIAEGLIYVKLATSIAAEDDEYIVPLEETIDMAKRGEFIELNIGVDFGGNGSGHAFVASGITQGYEKLYVLSSEWHDADGTDPDDLNRMFMKFVEKILDRYGFITNVYCDSAELVLKRGLQKAMIEAELGNINVTNAAKCKITDRIFTMTTLSATGRVFFTPDCESVLEAISMAVWNPKKMELERLDDGTSDIDSLDAMEYSFEKRIKKFIKKTG